MKVWAKKVYMIFITIYEKHIYEVQKASSVDTSKQRAATFERFPRRGKAGEKSFATPPQEETL